jgi:adenine deaminase
VQLKDGQPQIDETDLALIGVFARGEIGQSLGFIQGLGLQRGAIATTHAHDSHNLAVIGRDDQSMATAANAVIGMEGGMAVSVDNEVLARMPLPIAGIISDSPMPAVAHQLGRLTGVLADLGVKHPFLLMRLTTFTLPVSTGLRITDMGYVRAAERELVSLLIG